MNLLLREILYLVCNINFPYGGNTKLFCIFYVCAMTISVSFNTEKPFPSHYTYQLLPRQWFFTFIKVHYLSSYRPLWSLYMLWAFGWWGPCGTCRYKALEASGQSCAQLLWAERLSSNACASAPPSTMLVSHAKHKVFFLCSVYLLQKNQTFVWL